MEEELEVRSDGVRLAVRCFRGGEPGILLHHGLASSSHIFDLLVPHLVPAHRVVAYDARGHGRSGKPSSGYGFARLGRDALTVIRATGLRRPIAVGHSWGANVVLELAAHHPRAVRGVVLVDGGFLALRERMDWPTARELLAPPDLAGTPVETFLERLRGFLRGHLELTPEVEAVFLSLVRIDREGGIHPRLARSNHLRILRALWEQDALGLLGRVRVPTLVIGVRSAPGAPGSAGFMEEKRRAARRVRELAGPVRFAWIDGIHDVPLQRPAALARRVRRFASEVGGAQDCRRPAPRRTSHSR